MDAAAVVDMGVVDVVDMGAVVEEVAVDMIKEEVTIEIQTMDTVAAGVGTDANHGILVTTKGKRTSNQWQCFGHNMTISLWKDGLTIKCSVLDAEVQIATMVEVEGVVVVVAMAVDMTEETTDGESVRHDLEDQGYTRGFLRSSHSFCGDHDGFRLLMHTA